MHQEKSYRHRLSRKNLQEAQGKYREQCSYSLSSIFSNVAVIVENEFADANKMCQIPRILLTVRPNRLIIQI